jgi:tRNA U34 5-methylaminomethyl-2-thiouridine-forming methyltransferase MnmC
MKAVARDAAGADSAPDLDNGCEVVTLANGVLAIRERASGEVMHPGSGPRVEAESIYVAPSRLASRLQEGGAPLVLLDVGLGAATNAITAWQVSEAQSMSARRLEIVSFEHDLDALKLALRPENADAMGLTKAGANAHAAATAILAEGRYETPRTGWRLCLGDFPSSLSALTEASADIVFWDLFSPRTAPALWTIAMFRALRRVCRDGATVHTYSASTSTRSGFLLGGFAVGVGDPTGEHDETTIAATRVADLTVPLGARWLGRLSRSSMPLPSDVPGDPQAQADALERVRACPQFQSLRR